jgi:hypothetical protein
LASGAGLVVLDGMAAPLLAWAGKFGGVLL